MTVNEYKKEYHNGDNMMTDILRHYKCAGLSEEDIEELLEYAGEDAVPLSNIVTKE